ncbi:MAG: endonuclease/exonuclease/phosphatase family protein [Coriobacteriia bacterium]|nr:endonuclease/exonuclease/phosphatase family protein [Coriobacteriia bacterium]
MTYNIHHGQGIDGRFSAPRIARVLAAVNPDVVGLNEVLKLTGRRDQAAIVGDLLGMSHAYGETHRYSFWGAGNGIATRGLLTAVDRLDLPGGMERRQCLVTTIELDGVRFRFATAHLALNREARARSIEMLVNDLPDDLPLVLAGDFNAPISEIEPLRARLTVVDAPPTFPSWKPTKPLDVLAFSDHWRVTNVLVATSIASDHRPLVVDLAIRSGESGGE